MKRVKQTLLTIAVSFASISMFQGCTPKIAGMDSAYINKNRGAAGAQISQAEAKQYSRQQRLSADEIRLENMRRHQTTDAIQEGASATGAAAGAIHNIKGVLNLF
jgi:hypothetical protein